MSAPALEEECVPLRKVSSEVLYKPPRERQNDAAGGR